MALEDTAIIELYFRRDEDAIRQTDTKYGPFCRSVAGRILWDLRDVEECVSDTWAHTWNVIPPKRPGVFRAFLGRIARNLALNRFDYNNAQKRCTALTDAFDELADSLPAGEWESAAVDKLAFQSFLNGFLCTLSQTARRYFLLRYWYGMSIREIAREDQASEEAVASALFRARNRLREELEKEELRI